MRILSPAGYRQAEAPAGSGVQLEGAPPGPVHMPARWTKAVILRNSWPAMDTISTVVSDRLKERYGFKVVTVESFPTSSAAPEEVLDRASKAGDFVIIGAAT